MAGTEVYLLDINGDRIDPGQLLDVAADPVAESGKYLKDTEIGASHTETVVPGGVYAITCTNTVTQNRAMFFGIADVTINKNVLWVCCINETIIIRIPAGITELHYEGNVNNVEVRMRKLVS